MVIMDIAFNSTGFYKNVLLYYDIYTECLSGNCIDQDMENCKWSEIENLVVYYR